MTVADLEQSVRRSLEEAGLLRYLDEEETQFLEFPEGWFAEIVLKDASKVPQVEHTVERLKSDLKREQVELEEIIRPRWNLTNNIERVGASVSFPALESALRFNVTLQSGELTQNVAVDVTEAALGMIRERLSETKAPEDLALREIVGEFVKFELSHGGTSYWDPRRDPRLELNAATFMYLMGKRDAYERLKKAIDAVFKLNADAIKRMTDQEILELDLQSERQKSVEDFVKKLSEAQVRIRDFDKVLPYFPVAGKDEVYSILFDFEKDELKSYYLKQVDTVEEDYPELKKRVPDVFC